MFTSTLSQTLRFTLVAAILAVITPGALAQSDTGPARECIDRVTAIADRTVQANRQTATRTVAAIEELDANGAENRQIVGTGRMGKAAIERHSHASIARIHRVVSECVRMLRDNDAPPEAIAAVIRAGERATGQIVTSARHAKSRIGRAVAAAIE